MLSELLEIRTRWYETRVKTGLFNHMLRVSKKLCEVTLRPTPSTLSPTDGSGSAKEVHHATAKKGDGGHDYSKIATAYAQAGVSRNKGFEKHGAVTVVSLGIPFHFIMIKP